MRLSELQDKDVVDIMSGEKLGSVIDAEISSTDGKIMKLFIFEKKGFFSGIKGEEKIIDWYNIKKIGSDVILINKNS